MTNLILPALIAPRMTASHVAHLLEGVAFHEAGHAVAAFHLGGTLNSEGVSIDGRWYCGGRFQFPRLAPEHIVVPYMLAGDCAEFAFIGETEPSADRRQVANALSVACP